MKKYTNPELEIMLLEDGDILTFSIGELEGLDPDGISEVGRCIDFLKSLEE